MVKDTYIPAAGDFIWIDFQPTKGREQSKNRPALVVSPKSYNKKVGLLLVCPITSAQKGYPFEVSVITKEVTGVVLSDHIRSLDWGVCNIRFIKKAKPAILSAVLHKISVLLGDRM